MKADDFLAEFPTDKNGRYDRDDMIKAINTAVNYERKQIIKECDTWILKLSYGAGYAIKYIRDIIVARGKC